MKNSVFYRFRWHIAASVLMLTLVLGLLPMVSVKSRAAGQPSPIRTFPNGTYQFVSSGNKPPTDAYCRAHYGHPCYSPQEMQNAYGLSDMINSGYIGTGQTIVIIDSFGSPTIKSDLKTFDKGYGLPDPPSFRILSPLGSKKWNPGLMGGWGTETSLDVEWAHAMAPGANIVLMTSPISETQGIPGMPQFLFLEQYAVDHGFANIISQSWATTENNLFDSRAQNVLKSFNAFYKQAAADHVTVFASSGDSGVSNPNLKGQNYPFPTVNFPASDPYVTAVGGTSLMADSSGNYQSENGWQGSGGGVSQWWSEPAYQQGLGSSVQKILNGYRGIPDISYNADPSTSILFYASFPGSTPGYYAVGGTSEGSPQWAGIIADGNQFAGHPLGFINPYLYKLATGTHYNQLYHDILHGNNGGGGLPGYNCTTGWDAVTGLGTPNASQLLIALAKMEG